MVRSCRHSLLYHDRNPQETNSQERDHDHHRSNELGSLIFEDTRLGTLPYLTFTQLSKLKRTVRLVGEWESGLSGSVGEVH